MGQKPGKDGRRTNIAAVEAQATTAGRIQQTAAITRAITRGVRAGLDTFVGIISSASTASRVSSTGMRRPARCWSAERRRRRRSPFSSPLPRRRFRRCSVGGVVTYGAPYGGGERWGSILPGRHRHHALRASRRSTSVAIVDTLRYVRTYVQRRTGASRRRTPGWDPFLLASDFPFSARVPGPLEPAMLFPFRFLASFSFELLRVF